MVKKMLTSTDEVTDFWQFRCVNIKVQLSEYEAIPLL